ncbi:MAG: HAD family hydrolase [Thiotrichales bacterium]
MPWLIDEPAAASLRSEIRCITFDLDDTLWDCAQVIMHAETRLYHWFQEYYPAITERYSLEDLLPHRTAFLSDHQAHAHNLTHQRKLWLAALATEFSLDNSLVDPAFTTYWQARNEVTLFAGVIQALESLASHYTIGVITNGNADVNEIGIAGYFDFVVRSEEAGVAKPDPRIFQLAAAQAGVKMPEMLHIGDNLATDVEGALSAGARAIWVGEHNALTASEAQPHGLISEVAELVELLSCGG